MDEGDKKYTYPTVNLINILELLKFWQTPELAQFIQTTYFLNKFNRRMSEITEVLIKSER